MRRNALLRTAALVKALQVRDPDSEWTLVLPPITSHGWHSEEHSHARGFLPWTTFFDLEALQRLHPKIMELDEYRQLHPGPFINATVLAKLCDPALPSCQCDIEHVPHWPGVGGFQKREASSELQECVEHPLLLSIANVRFPGHLVCLPDEWLEAADERIVKAIVQHPAQSWYLHDQEQMIDRDASFWKLAIHLRISRHLVQLAREYQHDSLASKPYLAVHLRRGDFLQVHHEVVPSLQEVSKILQREADKAGLKTIFVATDGTQGRGHGAAADIESLRKRLRKGMQVQRYVGDPRGETLHLGEAALIEQVLCAEAEFFIGTQTSMFTDIILQERAVGGKSPAVSALFEAEGDQGYDLKRRPNSDGLLRDRGYSTDGYYTEPLQKSFD